MVMERKDFVIQNSDGTAQPGAAITVRVKSTGTVASIYSDEVFTAKANPGTTDADGRFWCYAADGDYTVAAGDTSLGDVTFFAGIAREQILRKTDNLPLVNNSTVHEDDSTLVFAVQAYETWEFRMHLLVSSNVATGFDFIFTIPAGATFTNKVWWLWDNVTLRASDSSDLDVESTYAGAVAALASDPIILHGLIVNGATAGNVHLQYAQNVAAGFNTSVNNGSYLIARKVT